MISSIRVPIGYDPPNTLWKANGFSAGYVGLQCTSNGERRIIFSVSDDGKGSDVQLYDKGNNAVVEKFSGEGSGARAYIPYNWAAGQTIHFKAFSDRQPTLNGTLFEGYYSIDGGVTWELVATLFAHKQPIWLLDMHDGLQNTGIDQSLTREAFYGNCTIFGLLQKTTKINSFTFTHTDPPFLHIDLWLQLQNLGKDKEVYQRIDGSLFSGTYTILGGKPIST